MNETKITGNQFQSGGPFVARCSGGSHSRATPESGVLPESSAVCLKNSLTVIILSYNRAAELRRTLAKMVGLPERPRIIVVDNASHDGSAESVARDFPQVALIRLGENLGACARNIGVAAAVTPYVAFCDDDTWWAPGSLTTAVKVFDKYPSIAVLNARVLVGPEHREDPTCIRMAESPLRIPELPGPALFGFLAGASAMRRGAFLESGGYEKKFFIGGEEGLLAIDLLAHGWQIVYLPDLTVHHYPSPHRDFRARQHTLMRNRWWLLWLRFPLGMACRKSLHMLPIALRQGVLHTALPSALLGFLWAMQNRVPVSADIARLFDRFVE